MPCEFDCSDCGVHVFEACADKPTVPPLCATCLHVPGWMNDQELRRIFGAGVTDEKEPGT